MMVSVLISRCNHESEVDCPLWSLSTSVTRVRLESQTTAVGAPVDSEVM